jgi:hypothetical protein
MGEQFDYTQKSYVAFKLPGLHLMTKNPHADGMRFV